MIVATNDALRRAAVLVASLDRDTADAVLEHMSDEQSAQIRQMIIGIDAISEVEARSTIEGFLHIDGSSHECQSTPDDPTIDLGLDSPIPAPAPSVQEKRRGLDEHLEAASDVSLVELLRDEQSQTIAVVLARVSAERASGIVMQLPTEKQADVLQRIVEADRLSTRLDDSIAEEFESWLISRLESAEQRSQLVARLSKIVGAAPPETQKRILSNLAATDISLSRDLGYDGDVEH